jgi:hypothetical protein
MEPGKIQSPYSDLVLANWMSWGDEPPDYGYEWTESHLGLIWSTQTERLLLVPRSMFQATARGIV